MENSPWRLIFIAAGASLILLLGVYLLVLPKTASYDAGNAEKILEFRSAFFSGHEKGKKIWEFYAKKGWSGKDKEITFFEDVSKGRFFNDGEVILKGLVAPRVKAWRTSKVVEAYGFFDNDSVKTSRLRAVIAFTPKGKRKFAAMAADKIIYDPEAKNSSLSGHISLKDRDSSLFAGSMRIEHDKETAFLRGQSRMVRKEISLSCDQLDYFAKEERFVPGGNVKCRIEGKPSPSRINCGFMEFYVDQSLDMTAVQSIEVFQGKKTALSDRLTYSNSKKTIMLSGRVKTVIEKARAILKEDTAKKLRSEEAKNLLREKTYLTSDGLELSTRAGDCRAYGNVHVFQKGREGKADEASYLEPSETLVLSGRVYLKKGKQWIRCQKIEISVRDETFNAAGSVEAEFNIKK